MQEQRSPDHFEFFGIDVIADADGECWLIEINRVPGLESSNNRCKPQEDDLFDEMMLSLLQMVLAPLRQKDTKTRSDNDIDDNEISKDKHPTDEHSCTVDKKSTSNTATALDTAANIKETVFNMEGDVIQESHQQHQHQHQLCTPLGWWRQVCEANPKSPPPSPLPSPSLFKNLFNWKAFTSKNKSKLFV